MASKLTKAQAEIALDTHRFKVLNCGRRFGKTTLSVEEIKGKIAAGKKHIAYIAPTYQQARDIAWEHFKKELQGASFNEARLEIRINDCIVVLRGWESVETLRGQQFDFIVIDEIAMMRDFWSAWQEVIRPTLTDTKGKVIFVSTPKGFNHFYDLYNMESSDADFKSFHFTSYDNPFLPVEEIDKAKLELTEDRFAQEYLADFRKTEGLVYKEFSREKHLFDDTQEIEDYEKIAGLDFGYTNPAAISFITIDTKKHYWITDEYYHSGRTEDEIADFAATKQFQRVYPDPESASGIAMLRKKGVNVREVNKGKDSIVHGIQKIRELFKANRLHIHKRCVNLISELETYSYPDKKDQRNPDELPIKEHDHLLDSVRYAIVTNESTRQANAPVYYAQSSMPINPMKGAPPLPTEPRKIATTYIPRL
jgi:PBSX family phage terminase large subunit